MIKKQSYTVVKRSHEFKETSRTLTVALLTGFGHELHELAQI